MIQKPFYDEKDYQIVLNLLGRNAHLSDDINRVYTRQLFLEGFTKDDAP